MRMRVCFATALTIIAFGCGGNVMPSEPQPLPASEPPAGASVTSEEPGCSWTADGGVFRRVEEWLSNGRLVRRVLEFGSGDVSTQTFTWDDVGRMTSRHEVDGSDFVGSTRFFVWSGRFFSCSDLSGATPYPFEVDVEDRILRYDNGDRDITGRGLITYDENGGPRSVSADGGGYCGGKAFIHANWTYDGTGGPSAYDYVEISGRGLSARQTDGWHVAWSNAVTPSSWRMTSSITRFERLGSCTDECAYEFDVDGRLSTVRCARGDGTHDDDLVRTYAHDALREETTIVSVGPRVTVGRFVVSDRCDFVPSRAGFERSIAPHFDEDPRDTVLRGPGDDVPSLPVPPRTWCDDGC